jgi:meso-butanediol dehydrogenase/(S,S)-butanediol dehydrogenase/diacetyl reductase
VARSTGRGVGVRTAAASSVRASSSIERPCRASMIHLTKQQALERSRFGIRIDAIAPGPVDTAMAQAVGFLCSDAAAYVNGQVVAVDGGFDAAGVGLPTLRRDLGAQG